jgi:DNA replication protein DnaC
MMPALQGLEQPQSTALGALVDGFESLDLKDLRQLELQLRYRFGEAMQRMDRAEADMVRNAARPVAMRLRQLQAGADFERACPIAWLHSVSEGDALKRVNSPTLVKLLADPLVLNRSLLVCGPTSAGKSTALGIMVRRTIDGGFIQDREKHGAARPHIAWNYARALAQASRSHPLGQGECEAVVSARRAGILVLDDLGLERDQAEIVDVVHERYEQGRVTWTTTGLTKIQLSERYGESFVRRLVEGRTQPGLFVNCFPKAA